MVHGAEGRSGVASAGAAPDDGGYEVLTAWADQSIVTLIRTGQLVLRDRSGVDLVARLHEHPALTAGRARHADLGSWDHVLIRATCDGGRPAAAATATFVTFDRDGWREQDAPLDEPTRHQVEQWLTWDATLSEATATDVVLQVWPHDGAVHAQPDPYLEVDMLTDPTARVTGSEHEDLDRLTESFWRALGARTEVERSRVNQEGRHRPLAVARTEAAHRLHSWARHDLPAGAERHLRRLVARLSADNAPAVCLAPSA